MWSKVVNKRYIDKYYLKLLLYYFADKYKNQMQQILSLSPKASVTQNAILKLYLMI